MACLRQICISSILLGIFVTVVVADAPPGPPLDIDRGLLFLKGQKLQLKNLNSIKDETITLVELPFADIRAVDYYRNKTVYYSTFTGPIASLTKKYRKLMPFNDRWIPGALAVDIICKNVYVYDGTAEKMYVIDIQNKHTGIILSDRPRVKDIAINPFLRWIFMLTSSSVRKLLTSFIQ